MTSPSLGPSSLGILTASELPDLKTFAFMLILYIHTFSTVKSRTCFSSAPRPHGQAYMNRLPPSNFCLLTSVPLASLSPFYLYLLTSESPVHFSLLTFTF